MQNILGVAALALAAMTASPLQAAERVFELDPFTAVDISSGIDAVVTVGGEQNVRATAPGQEELDELQVEVRDGRLHAGVDWNLLDFLFFDDREIVLHITIPALDAAEASSGADVEVDGLLADAVTLGASSGADLLVHRADGSSFRIEVSSGADLQVEGDCEQAVIEVSSGATLRADRLTCEAVEVNASSGGDADLYASTRLTAEASSGADIRVLGNPTAREVEESSGGEVSFAD